MHQDKIFSTPKSSKALSYYQSRKLQQLIATSSSPKVRAKMNESKMEEMRSVRREFGSITISQEMVKK
jgi:hypothetical protein